MIDLSWSKIKIFKYLLISCQFSCFVSKMKAYSSIIRGEKKNFIFYRYVFIFFFISPICIFTTVGIKFFFLHQKHVRSFSTDPIFLIFSLLSVIIWETAYEAIWVDEFHLSGAIVAFPLSEYLIERASPPVRAAPGRCELADKPLSRGSISFTVSSTFKTRSISLRVESEPCGCIP